MALRFTSLKNVFLFLCVYVKEHFPLSSMMLEYERMDAHTYTHTHSHRWKNTQKLTNAQKCTQHHPYDVLLSHRHSD